MVLLGVVTGSRWSSDGLQVIPAALDPQLTRARAHLAPGQLQSPLSRWAPLHTLAAFGWSLRKRSVYDNPKVATLCLKSKETPTLWAWHIPRTSWVNVSLPYVNYKISIFHFKVLRFLSAALLYSSNLVIISLPPHFIPSSISYLNLLAKGIERALSCVIIAFS